VTLEILAFDHSVRKTSDKKLQL